MKKHTPTLTLLVLTAVTICFGFNASTLDNHATQSLDSIVQQSKSFTDYAIHLSGHTDDLGSDSYNDKLSEKRVIAVKNYLIAKNIDSTKIKFDTYGEHMPRVPNTSDSNRALNRSVELTISGQKIDTSYTQTPSRMIEQSEDTIKTLKRNSVVILPNEKKLKKKKNKRRLIWTGWKTGFHWSTSG